MLSTHAHYLIYLVYPLSHLCSWHYYLTRFVEIETWICWATQLRSHSKCDYSLVGNTAAQMKSILVSPLCMSNHSSLPGLRRARTAVAPCPFFRPSKALLWARWWILKGMEALKELRKFQGVWESELVSGVRRCRATTVPRGREEPRRRSLYPTNTDPIRSPLEKPASWKPVCDPAARKPGG